MQISRWTLLFCFVCGLCGSPICGQELPLNLPKLPPLPTGVTPLPQVAPPTGPQGTVPAPALPVPKADRPRRASPTPQQLGALVVGHPISVTDAVAIALSTNRDLAQATASLLSAVGRTGEARAALNPTVGIQPAAYDYLHDQFEPAAVAAATLPIDISGLLRAAADQAHYQEIGARLDVNRIRNQIVSDVKSAFYDVLRAQALEHVANENLQGALFNLGDAQKKLEARTVTRFDVIQAQTDVAAAQQQVIRARNTSRRSIGLLNNVMGIDIMTPLQVQPGSAVEMPPNIPPPITVPGAGAIQGVPPAGGDQASNPGSGEAAIPGAGRAGSPQPGPQPPAQNGIAGAAGTLPDSLDLGPEFQGVLKEALATRPEVMQAESNMAAAERGIVIARTSELPTASIQAGYWDERNFTGTTRVQEPRVFLTFNIPIYDGGLARARNAQARAAVSSAETSQRQAADLVTLDVQQAYLNLVQARDQVVVANQALAQAQAGQLLARVRYEAGVSAHAGISPLIELSGAQVALTAAETNQVNALYDYNAARAQLDRAVGRYAFVLNGPGYASPLPSTARKKRP
jgi:outer membrane protein TolC